VPDAYDETWAKLVLPEDTWRSMPTLLPTLTDPRTRVAVWNALQLAVADAEMDPNRGVDLVVAALPAEGEDAVVASVGRWAARALLGGYLDADARAGATARIADAMLAVAGAAGPGSSRQLAAARVAIATTLDVGVLDAWLTGSAVPPGLVVDADLRWALLHRLAALGGVSADAIDAELENDHSSQGAVHAARCRAARPDPAAKRAAWEALMADPERPNYELYALAEGFWEPDQLSLTQEYVGEYFDRLPAASSLRSGWVADRVALLAYPWPAVGASTAAATQRLLEQGDLPSGVRRSVVDAGDDLRRALAVRERFGLAPAVV
jgi:aminopeptidase N